MRAGSDGPIADHAVMNRRSDALHILALAMVASLAPFAVVAAPPGGTTTAPPTTAAPTTPPTTAPPPTQPPTTAPPTTQPPTTAAPTTQPAVSSSSPPSTAVPVTTQPPVFTTIAPPPATAPPPTATPTLPPLTIPPTTQPPIARNIQVLPEQTEWILATIRYVESRGRYELPPNRGNASGAYQFIESTWNNYAGFQHAYQAPPEIQDERAALDVAKFLARWDNDVSMIPIMWYYPKAATDPSIMDIVPVPSAGNVLTVREYQQRWLAVFASLSGQPLDSIRPAFNTIVDTTARLGAPPVLGLRIDNVPNLSFPVLGPSAIAPPDCGTTETPVAIGDLSVEERVKIQADNEAAGLCEPEAPSVIFGVKLQPITAVFDGVVTDVDDDPGRGPIALTITDLAGRSVRYAGFNDDNPGTDDGFAPPHLRLTALATVGRTVRAGQIIGFMGNSSPLPLAVRADVPTDPSNEIPEDEVAPHIRLTMKSIDGSPIDAFGPVVDALFAGGCRAGLGPWSVPPRLGTNDSVVIETVDDDPSIDSQWVITSTGQVQASGWAALISPDEFCGWAPSGRFGPGAGGSDNVPSYWENEFDLPTRLWIDVSLQDGARVVAPLFRM